MSEGRIIRVVDNLAHEFYVDLDACPWAEAALYTGAHELPAGFLRELPLDEAPPDHIVIRGDLVTVNAGGAPLEVDLSLPCNWNTAARIARHEVPLLAPAGED